LEAAGDGSSWASAHCSQASRYCSICSRNVCPCSVGTAPRKRFSLFLHFYDVLPTRATRPTPLLPVGVVIYTVGLP
jgi:hypothetical protein